LVREVRSGQVEAVAQGIRRITRDPEQGANGFTLIEVLLAAAVIAVAMVAVGGGLSYGLAGIEAGKQQTTATFLAEQRLEQIRAATYPNVTAANFPAEGYGTIPNAPTYRRAVTITDNPAGVANTKRVEVSVFYRPVMAFGVLAAEREVRLSTLITDR
jgi:prepilin-type N-terminal cleavage/methylation domain-containing protein